MKKVISIVLALSLICTVFYMTASARGRIGDANNDGKLSATDARMILQHVAGVKTIEDITNLDMNNDNKISAVDARKILQIVAGIAEDPADQQLKTFVDSFNNVKKNAKSATLEHVRVYECEEYSGTEELREAYEDMMRDTVGEKDVNHTYTGDDIDANFPPVGATCSLSFDDIKDFYFVETENYYMVSFKVKGEKNPKRGKGVGAVADIITKEELEAAMKEELGSDMTDAEFKALIQLNSRYNDVTVKAKIEKATGNMLEYYVDAPYVMEFSMMGMINMNMGIGTASTWKIVY
jgi:hypothetical protein